MIKNILDAALALAADGYPVFPCATNKRPVCQGGFHSAKADRYAIEELWESSPGDLIGVPTGLLFDVLDIDAKHESARNWWNAHRDALPRTRAHRTRSGGLHLLFRPNPDVACSAGKLAPGVDVRGRGGYVIWWPASGFAVLSEAPLAPWPDFLLEKFRPEPQSPKANPSTFHGDGWLRGLIRVVAQSPEGRRNAVLFWASCRAGEVVRDGKVDEAFVTDVLVEAAARAGLPRTEAERTARSGIVAGGGRV